MGFYSNAYTFLGDSEIQAHWLRWQAATLLRRKPCLIIAGNEFRGFPNFSAYLGAWKYRPSLSELRYLEECVKSADTILDVGANFGVISCACSRFAPSADIWAFEPTLATAEALQDNVRRNGITNVRIVRSAVGASDGTTMFQSSSDPATNHISLGAGDAVRVPLTTLDTFLDCAGIEAVDFLKIDTEGADFDVLRGAARAFDEGRISRGLIELCPGTLRRYGYSVKDVSSWLRGKGYRLFELSPDYPSLQSDSISEDSFVNAGFERCSPDDPERSPALT